LFIPKKIFAFASETIAFKYLEGYKREIDKDIIKIELRHPFIAEGAGHTIFKDIKQILPGHFLEIKLGAQSINQNRWWSTAQSILDDLPASYEERVEIFKKLISDSCKLRMRSDVPIATALSGGLDSSAVYCTLNNLMDKDPKLIRSPKDWRRAFVGIFPGTPLDEQKYAEKIIDFTKGIAQFVSIDDKRLAENVKTSTILFDAVYSSPIFAASNIYSAMKKSGIKVSIDGHGADEMLFGYQSMIDQAYIYCADHGYDSKELHDIFGNMYHSPEGVYIPGRGIHLKFKTFLRRLLPDSVKTGLQTIRNHARGGSKVSTPKLQYLGEQDIAAHTIKGLDRITYEIFHTRTLPTILRNFDRASMQHGVEVRMPFMDWKLVQYIFSLPFTDKIYGGFNKRILRDSLRGSMPEEIRTRKLKIGLNGPMIEWFSGPLKALIMNIVSSKDFMESDLWNGRQLRNIIEKNMHDDSWTWNECSKIWPYISASIIIKNNSTKS